MLKRCYFEPCLLQVLSTFCVLISVINPIGTLRSQQYYGFCGYFCSFCKLIRTKLLSQVKHKESKLNSKLTIEVGRKLEQQTKEKWPTVEILQGYEFSQPAKFRRLQIFSTCFASIFYFHLTLFNDFFLNCPSCFVGSLNIFVISLDSEQYISLSQALYR